MDTLKVALIQMPVVTDKAANLQRAEAALRQAAAEGAQLAVLPEMWNTPYDTAVFADYAEDPEGASCTLLRQVARETAFTTPALFVMKAVLSWPFTGSATCLILMCPVDNTLRSRMCLPRGHPVRPLLPWAGPLASASALTCAFPSKRQTCAPPVPSA